MPDVAMLRDKFNSRSNNLTILRLALAGIVLIVHSQALRTDTQPSVLRADLGQMAVDGFFILSGFLVTGSARRLDCVRRFLWHRALRVLPGFWVCLVTTAFVCAPVLAMTQGRSPLSVFSGPDSALGFVVRNAGLLIRQWGIAGLTTAETEPGAMNGSLWSLYYEAVCYVLVAVLIFAGVVRPRVARAGRHRQGPLRLLGHRREVLAVTAGTIWLTLIVDLFGPVLPMDKGRLMIFMFMVGVLAELYAEHIPMDGRIAVGAFGYMIASCGIHGDYQVIGAPGLAYVLLWLAVAAPVPFQLRNDISYGIYMYHWPIILMLIWIGLDDVGVVIFTVLSVGLTAAAATASWVYVERPMMRFRHAYWVTQPPVRTTQPIPVRDVVAS